MTGQPWLAATFAVMMIGTAGYCLTRLAESWCRRRPTDRHVDGMHVLMGVAMAGMLVPRLRLLWAGGWEIIFAAGAALFAYRIARAARACRPHDAQHLLGCAAMVYMLAFIAPVAARAGSTASGMLSRAAPDPAVPLLLAVALLGCVVWTADRMTSMAPVAELAALQPGAQVGSGTAVDPRAPAGPAVAQETLAAVQVPLSPRLSGCCEIATGVTMGYMLIMMLT
jgi:Domain of unknown function (DUF5134)